MKQLQDAARFDDAPKKVERRLEGVSPSNIEAQTEHAPLEFRPWFCHQEVDHGEDGDRLFRDY